MPTETLSNWARKDLSNERQMHAFAFGTFSFSSKDDVTFGKLCAYLICKLFRGHLHEETLSSLQ
jgi:hypothetical protein